MAHSTGGKRVSNRRAHRHPEGSSFPCGPGQRGPPLQAGVWGGAQASRGGASPPLGAPTPPRTEAGLGPSPSPLHPCLSPHSSPTSTAPTLARSQCAGPLARPQVPSCCPLLPPARPPLPRQSLCRVAVVSSLLRSPTDPPTPHSAFSCTE